MVQCFCKIIDDLQGNLRSFPKVEKIESDPLNLSVNTVVGSKTQLEDNALSKTESAFLLKR